MSDVFYLAGGILIGLIGGAVIAWRRSARASEAELARARAEVSRRLADVFALQELSYALSESLQPKRIAEQVIGYLQRFTDVEGALVALTSERSGRARVAAASGGLAGLRDRDITEDDPGLLIASLGHERMLQADDASGTRPLVAGGVSARQVVAFPLRAHGVTVGALAVADPRRGTFDQQTLRLLSTVATHAAIVLSNARFFDLVRAAFMTASRCSRPASSIRSATRRSRPRARVRRPSAPRIQRRSSAPSMPVMWAEKAPSAASNRWWPSSKM